MTIDLAGFPARSSSVAGPDLRGFVIPSASGSDMKGAPLATPRTADPDFANVLVLWLADEGNGATTPIDRSSNNWPMTRVGSAAGSNAIAGPFGGTCWRLGGATDSASVTHVATDWGTLTNYTFEAWMYADSGSGDLTLCASSTQKYWASKIGATTYVGDGVTNTIAAAMTFPTATWQHLAVVKEDTSYSLYLQGVRIANSTTAIGTGLRTLMTIGSRDGLNTLPGYIGSFRATRNVARYSGATYTVPTLQFPSL